MTDWERYWNEEPKKFAEKDFLKQVGKTENGHSVQKESVDRIVHQLLDGLDMTEDDIVLDLCCGNGLITHRVSRHCDKIVGVDFSERLIEIAQEHHGAANICYVHSSVLTLTPKMFAGTGRFTKVYMYEGLQHFNEDEVLLVLRVLQQVTLEGAPVYLGSVPDKDRIWLFYNTPVRRNTYFRRKSEGREAIGTWWDREVLRDIAKEEKYHCEFINQDAALYTAHYRFDVRIQKDRE